ncbi:MAG: hypothetical protein IJ366_10145 [Clostridia bacterium]|nr:hypothetical protein [Clostridia bacterium]
MDIRTRQAMRRRKRQKQRRTLAVGALILAVLIAVLCFAFSGSEEASAPPEPTPTPEATATPEPTPTPTPEPQTAEEFTAAMSLDDKLLQLFIVTADSLTGVENTTLYGGTSQRVISEKPVGGIMYTAGNIESKAQLSSMISNVQKQYTEENGFPAFIVAEEEGGSVSPLAAAGLAVNVGDMSAFAEGENYDGAYAAGSAIGKYMKSLGFNMNLAPFCELSDGESPRSFGSDAETVSSMAVSVGDGMNSGGIIPVYNAFPGKTSSATLAELEQKEFLPFQMAAANGAEAMLVSANPEPVITGSSVPCYTSSAAVTDILRTSLDFDGIIITAPLVSDESVVSAIEAGCDMLLMPKDLASAVAQLKSAVETGRITEERINQSVRRIISLKLSM